MKKKDLILGGTILLIAVIMLLVMQMRGSRSGNEIVIKQDGKVYGTYSLAKDQDIAIEEGDNHNTVRIRGGKAWMQEADCPDGYCKQQGKISKEGQTIVCLPHKLVVEVQKNASGSGDVPSEEPDTIAK